MMNRGLRFLIAIALMFAAAGATRSFALELPKPEKPLLTFRYDLYGETQEELVRTGSIRAIKSVIGRIYFTDYMIRGRSVLDAYLDQNWKRFIARSVVKSTEIRGGRRFVSLEVVVDVPKVYADLDEKKFLYRPELRPVFYTFVSETFDDQPTTGVGRLRLLELIDERQYRYLWEEGFGKPGIPVSEKREVQVSPPMLNEDMSKTPELLQAACEQAQRNEVEVFITGSIETRVTRMQKVYYDTYTFVETSCSLKVVRSDDGQIIASGGTITSNGNIDPAKAVKAATLAAVNEIAPKLLDSYAKQWGKMILHKADVRVMIEGVQADTLQAFRQLVKAAAPGCEVYTHAAYADIAVVTVTWGGKTEDLDRILRQTFYPAFEIDQVSPKEMILKVLPKPTDHQK